jgi:hypothetical protein
MRAGLTEGLTQIRPRLAVVLKAFGIGEKRVYAQPLIGSAAALISNTDMRCDSRINLKRLPYNGPFSGRETEGKALRRTGSHVEAVLADHREEHNPKEPPYVPLSAPVYWIGYTSLSIMRAAQYLQEGVMSFHPLYYSESMEAARMMEASLIGDHEDQLGCRNVLAGGDGPRVGSPPYWVYIAVADPIYGPRITR